MNLPDGRTFEKYQADIRAYRERQGAQAGQPDRRPAPLRAGRPADTLRAPALQLCPSTLTMRRLSGSGWSGILTTATSGNADCLSPAGGPRSGSAPTSSTAEIAGRRIKWQMMSLGRRIKWQMMSLGRFGTPSRRCGKSGEVKVTWRTLRSWLPLAEHDIATLQGVAHNVTGALKWCREQTMTPGEIADEKAERKERKVSAREEGRAGPAYHPRPVRRGVEAEGAR